MTLRRVLVTQPGGGGSIPGAAVMTDSYSMVANVGYSDPIPAQADTVFTQIVAQYLETNQVQADKFSPNIRIDDAISSPLDTYQLRILIADQIQSAVETFQLALSASDSIAQQTDSIALALSGLSDAIATAVDSHKLALALTDPVSAQTEIMKLVLSGFADQIAAQAEAAKVETSGSGLNESNVVPGEARTSMVRTWATTQATSGTAPTNPNNALGQNNGTLANVRSNAVTGASSTLTLTIPRASIPNAGSKTFLAWYNTVVGVTDTVTLRYTDTGGNPATADLPNGNFLTNPASVAITGLHASNNITFQITHASVGPPTTTGIDVDAVAIESNNPF